MTKWVLMLVSLLLRVNVGVVSVIAIVLVKWLILGRLLMKTRRNKRKKGYRFLMDG